MILEREVNPDKLETRTALLEQSIGHVNQTLIRIEKKLEKHDDEFKDLRKEMRSDFKWTIGLLVSLTTFTIAGFTGLLGIMAHGFHWI
jgi:uncharacterized coiled-coil protein SlyX